MNNLALHQSAVAPFVPPDKQLTPDEMIELTIQGLRSEHSRKAYRGDLRRFFNWYEGKGYHGFDAAIVEAYKGHLFDLDPQPSPSTINRALASIKRMAKRLAIKNQIPRSVLVDLSLIDGVANERPPAGRFIEETEIQKLLATCAKATPKNIRDASIISLMYCTGMRRASIIALDFEDYDPETGKLVLRNAKGGKTIETYVQNGAKKCLDNWVDFRGNQPGAMYYEVKQKGWVTNKRISHQGIYHILKWRSEKANLPPLTPHDFRRTFCSNGFDIGLPAHVIAGLVGHKNVATTMRYDRRGERAKQEASYEFKLDISVLEPAQ